MKIKLALVFALIACLLFTSACSKAKNGSSADEGNKNAAESTNSPKPADQADTKSDGIDMTKKFSLEYLTTGTFDEPPINENPIKQKIQEDMNIDLKVTASPESGNAYSQLLTTRVAAGDLPDIGWVTRADMIKLAVQGSIIPLDDLLNKVPDLKASRTDNEWLLSTVNNKIYGVSRTSRDGSVVGTFIRKDWLDHLNLKVPTTTEELVTVLKAFTLNDPDGNGKNDTYGYSAPDLNSLASNPLANAFGLPQIGVNEPGVPEDWVDEQGKLHFGSISDEYKQYLTYMNELQSAGVLDPDLPTNTMTTFQQKVVQGQVGMFTIQNPQVWMFDSNPRLRNNILKANPNANWIYMDPVKGPDGHAGINASSPSAGTQIVIFKNVLKEEGKADRVIALLNYMDARKDGEPGGQMLNFGIPELHQKEVDGKMTLTPEFKKLQQQYINAYNMSQINPFTPKNDFIFTDRDQQEFKRMNDGFSHGNLIASSYYNTLPFVYDGSKYVAEMGLKFVYGKEDLGKWDEYVQTLNDRYKYSEVQKDRTEELKNLGVLK